METSVNGDLCQKDGRKMSMMSRSGRVEDEILIESDQDGQD